MPGDTSKLKLSTFIKNCNSLISLSYENPGLRIFLTLPPSKKNSSCGEKPLYSQDYLRRKIDLRRKSIIFVANYAENEIVHTRK